jgi:hypothetical protein
MSEILSNNDYDPSFLIIIIDSNTIAWNKHEKNKNDLKITYDALIKDLILFCNAYSLLHRQNRLMIISRHRSSIEVVFPSKCINVADREPNYFSTPSKLAKSLKDHLSNLQAEGDLSSKSTIAQALTHSLCGINFIVSSFCERFLFILSVFNS